MFIKKIFIISFSLIVVSLSAQESGNYRKTLYSSNKTIILFDLLSDNQIKGVHYQGYKYFSLIRENSVNNFSNNNFITKSSVLSPDSLISKGVTEKYNTSLD